MKRLEEAPTLLADPWLSPSEVAALIPGRLLGTGESAEVRQTEAVDPETGAVRRLALKVALPGRQDALGREAQTLLLAGGGGVPRLFGVGSTGGRLALVLELLEGSSPLALEPSAAPATELAGRVLRQAGSALRQLHLLGISHGDVKPDNLLVCDDGRVMLLDLGLSTENGDELRGATPAYLDAACAVVGRRDRACARDLFALALTCAEILDPSLRGGSDPRRGQQARLPPPFARLLGPILTQPPERRPGLSWLLGELDRFTPEHGPEGFERERTRQLERRVRSTYLAVRREEVFLKTRKGGREVHVEVAGRCGSWLRQLSQTYSVLFQEGASQKPLDERPLGSIDAESDESGLSAPIHGEIIRNLALHERCRFVSLVAGPHWAGMISRAQPDDQLAEWLLRGAYRFGLGCVPSHLLLEMDSTSALEEGADHPGGSDPVRLALALAETPVRPQVLAAIERLEPIPSELALKAARILARRGESFRAFLLLDQWDDLPQAQLLKADWLRRRGDRDQADGIIENLLAGDLSEELRARVLALKGRRAVDEQRAEVALKLLHDQPPLPPVCETRALALLAEGRAQEGWQEAQNGLFLSSDDEQSARLHGVSGMIEHSLGRAERAMKAFARARDLGAAAGALVEEATYATGLAAAASDAGQLAEALEAAERAERIFESLEDEGAAARAVLGQVSVLSLLGAVEELEQRAERGVGLARLSSDSRCAGFIELCLADGLTGRRGHQAARRGGELLARGSAEDRLRAAARRLNHGWPLELDGDDLASQVASIEARIDWWGARARRLARESEDGRLEAGEAVPVLSQLTAVAAEESPPIVAGPALIQGRKLALAVGQVEVARALHCRARDVASCLLAGAGPELKSRVSELSWVQEALASSGEGFQPAQLSDVESLLRTFSQRRGLRDLLRHALDLLLLWTGVERGLMLLAAPGDRLVVRAARNLSREDLSEEQLQLSRTMAARAMAEGRPVVTVDAQREGTDWQRSAHALKLRSILSVPLTAHGTTLGVAYLDDRMRPGAFGPKELSWTQLIGTVTALAVSEERDRLHLRRVARRARRAERRLEDELARTQGQLEVTARELSEARSEVYLRGEYSDIVGRSPAMTRVLQLLDRVSAANVPVLLVGESGTGKELVARAIKRNSDRADRPFIAENCSAIPEALLESTLFGYRRGAFTGASRDQAGLFELADGGTLFLDEIGEMSLAMQAKLLRVLQDGQVRALGAQRSRGVDVRIIAATHRDLSSMVAEGTFREDLFYRLNVVPVRLPALRERPEDIDVLVDHFISRYDPQGGRTVSRNVRQRLRNFSWPGNVRQLENEVRRVLLLGDQEIGLSDLSPELLATAETGQSQTLKDKLNELERTLVIEALEANRGNRTRAAQALGVSRFGLQKMMQRLSIDGF